MACLLFFKWVVICCHARASKSTLTCVFQEGKEYLLKSVGLWLPVHKQNAASSSTDTDAQVSASSAQCFSDGSQPSEDPGLFIKYFRLMGLSQCALQ